FTMSDRFERRLGTVNIKSDFCRMDFQGELHSTFAKDIHDGIESFSELSVTGINHRLRHGREGIEQMPDAGTGETIHYRHAKLLRGAGRVLQFFNGPLIHSSRITISPDVIRQNG